MNRHCMVVHSHYPVGETRVQRQALALVDAGIEVDVLCLRGEDEPRREVVDGVNVRRLPVKRHRDRGFAWQLVEYFVFFVLAGTVLTRRHLRRRYQSVQVHNLPDFLVFCALVPKLTGAEVLLDLHDLMPEFFSAKTKRGMGHPLVRIVALQERLSCAFADQVITVSKRWERTLIERGVPARKVTIVMNLADQRMFASSPRDRSTYNGSWRVLYHGTITHRYGVDLLVRAVHAVGDEIPGIRLDLVGDGDGRAEVEALIDTLDLHGRVKVSEGMVDASLLPSYLHDADLGVVPNRLDVFTDDLLPTKLLEYVAVGTPVAAARTSGVMEYFDDTMVAYFDAGDVASLADCLRSLYQELPRLNQLADSAAEFNSRYNWDSTAADYVEMIKRSSGD
jgi:glycosyltransferase involved in cell wall biosynthesis